MRTPCLLTGLLLLAACNGAGGSEARTTVPLTYLRADEAARLASPHISERVTMSIARDSAAVREVKLAGPRPEVDRIADLIRRSDRPANVQLRFQLIEADGFTGTDPEIADVEAALRDVFRFRGYRLLGESLVQTQAPGHVAQLITAADGAPFQLEANLDRPLPGDSARTVSLAVELRGQDAMLSTSLNVPSGKTVVIGTARARRGGNTLILVVRPRIE